MNKTDLATAGRFFCFVKDKVEGPFDLIELAGQLKYSNIDAETLICREGKDDWSAFRDWPEFLAVQNISVEEIARHLEEKQQAEASAGSSKNSFPWINRTTALFLFGAVVFALIFSYLQNRYWAQGTSTFVFPKQYRLEMTSTMKGHPPLTSEIFEDNGKRRTEVDLNGRRVFIVRPDLGKVYQIIVDRKIVLQRPFNLSNSQLGMTGPSAKLEPLDTEDLDGVPCTKYRVTTSGRIWFLWVDTAKQAPVKSASENGVATNAYKNYQEGPQDPALFELPADYQVMPMPDGPSGDEQYR